MQAQQREEVGTQHDVDKGRNRYDGAGDDDPVFLGHEFWEQFHGTLTETTNFCNSVEDYD